MTSLLVGVAGCLAAWLPACLAASLSGSLVWLSGYGRAAARDA